MIIKRKKMNGTSTVEFVIVAIIIIVLITTMLPKVWELLEEHHDEYINGMASPDVSISLPYNRIKQ